MESMIGQDHKFPEQNCCACGGKWSPSVSEALNELEIKQASVKGLETQILKMTQNLASAEKALNDAEQNASIATENLIILNNKTLHNLLEIHDQGQRVADLQSSTELEEQDLSGTEKVAKGLLNSTGNMDGDFGALSKTETLNQLEDLNQKIWDAAEPEGETSIKQAQDKVSQLLVDAQDFHGRLRGRVKEVLVQRFRPGVHEVRHALQGLRTVATLGV